MSSTELLKSDQLLTPGTSTPSPRYLGQRFFYRLALPAVWLMAALVSWTHPGDEYLLFILVCGLPGAWVTLLFGRINPLEAAPILFGAGMITMALVGWALDSLRVWRSVWLGLYAFGSVGLLICMLSGYPSYERALARNGTVSAYASAAANMSLYLTSTVCVAATVASRLMPLAYRRLTQTT